MQPRQEPPALTDAPEMDGLGACRRIRALPGGGLPIIASTANALAGDRERCLAAGMDGYLTKPLEPEALDAELGRWLGRRSCATSVGSIHRSSPPQVGCPLLRVQVRRLFGLAVTAGVNLSPSHRWTAGSDWGSRVYRDSGSILIPRRRKVVAMIVPPFGSA